MTGITTQMLESLIADLKHKNAGKKIIKQQITISNKPDSTTKILMGLPQETPTEIAKLQQALSILSSDVDRGTGSFYDPNGQSLQDYWLAGIWAIASLGWNSGKDIAREWSQKSSRYTDDGFEGAWNSYNPAHPNAIGIGSLYKRANELSYTEGFTAYQSTLNPIGERFTLLGINDLAALPPTEHLIKGILPRTGLGAIYGPANLNGLDTRLKIPQWFMLDLRVKVASITASKHGALITQA
jgi:hypothetical protein